MSSKKNSTDRARKAHRLLPLVVSISLVASITCAGLAYLAIKDLQNGTIQLCAKQQDAYVQLVLDQINLESDRNDDEIISNILGTLDASTNKYWVFSRDQTMLFVKDVTETNKYKGFTAESFYGTDSASSFVNSLETNAVAHSVIVIDDVEYVASGAKFMYGGQEYRICLLTNKAVLLDDNAILGATSRVGALLMLLIAAAFISIAALAWKADKARAALANSQSENAALYKQVNELNDALLKPDADEDDQHGSRRLWDESKLDAFISEIIEQGLHASAIRLAFDSEDALDAFLERTAIVCGGNVIHIKHGEMGLVLLFVATGADTARGTVDSIAVEGMRVIEETSI